MKKQKGFTLVELLSVIVIIAILLSIAIPAISSYITQSRKKTLVNTIDNYMRVLSNDVNDLQYTFSEDNTIYAIPIDCISLERGGTNPFGKWIQASKAYFAYVLVQYNDKTLSYQYGYTFKDSAGYGMYPTVSNRLDKSGTQISRGLDLIKPKTGLITELTSLENWEQSGFNISSTTELMVLDSTSEGVVGDGVETCTLFQKADNYDIVEEEKIGNKYLCKRATTLHTEECTRNDGHGCESGGYTLSGSKGTTTIEYGNLGTLGTLKSGDAFDCDVNGDRIHDPDTERFYYVSDLASDSSYAVLIYYNNTVNGIANSSSSSVTAFQSTTGNGNGPDVAIKHLPTKSQWKRSYLSNYTRDLLDENDEVRVKDFDYTGYAARLITKEEINKACNIKVGSYVVGELNTCLYLLENTQYASLDQAYGIWTESLLSNYAAFYINPKYPRVSNLSGANADRGAVRPVIEVSKSKIQN